ncbi:MAG TPA: DUF3341 domain-containing protein [Pseudomonadota bacterium]|jgi:hypothetical protein|nr:DUF3341 domain-containing protein [Pseudomonadota bacterium]
MARNVGVGYEDGVFGVVAEYKTPGALLEAVKTVRQAGFSVIDTYTPFPVHGMDRAMGLKPTILPYLVLCGGLLGVGAAVLIQWWMNAFDYPFIIGGKPIVSYQAYVPICFEMMVLLSAFTTVFSLFALCRLPQPYHPLFTHDRFSRFSDDGFFLGIEAQDPIFSEARARETLAAAGGTEIAVIRDFAET